MSCRESPVIDVKNEATGIVLTVTLPFVGVTKTNVDHATKTIRIVVEPDLDKMCSFAKELPRELLDVVRVATRRCVAREE